MKLQVHRDPASGIANAIGIVCVAGIAVLAARAAVAETLLLRASGVYPVSSEPIERGEILVRDGKIAAVGRDLEVPADARVIDVDGIITPGFIDAGSSIGVRGRAAEEFSEVTPQIQVLDAVDLDDDDFDRARRSGVTAVAITPGARNVVGGLGAVVSTAGGSLQDTVLGEASFVAACLTPEASSGNRSLRGTSPYSIYFRIPTTRMGSVFVLRRAFVEALGLEPQRDDASGAAGGDTADAGSLRRSLSEEARTVLGDCRQGKPRQLRIRADVKQEIQAALRIADEFGLDIALEGALEAGPFAAELAKRKIDVFLRPGGPVQSAGRGADTPQSLDLARVLADAGVRIAFFSDAGSGVASLRSRMALDIRFGLSESDALRAATLDAASMLGVEKQIGSLEVGKRADLVAFDGDPFATLTEVRFVMQAGEIERPEDGR